MPPKESAMTGYLWFPEETELWLLQAALQLLRPLTPLPFSTASPQSTGQRLTCCAMPHMWFEQRHCSQQVQD